MKSIEEQIKRAIEEGKFEQLPGKGKPIHLDENPYEDPEWGTAYRMLRGSGFTLPWIESRREIEELIAEARTSLLRAWEWRNNTLDAGQPPREVDQEWKRALRLFEQQVETINKKIKSYNLEVPIGSFQVLALDKEDEIELVLRDVEK